MTVNDVYVEVCDILLEPGGLSLGLLTEDEFLGLFGTVVMDFLQQTGLVKRLVNVPVEAGTAQYEVPDHVMQVQEVLYAERYLHRETGEALDNLAWMWRGKSGPPQRWREDRLQPKRIELQPQPATSGYTVTAGNPWYGVLSAVSAAVLFTIVPTAPAYGVPSSYSGPIYVESVGTGFGVVNGMTVSSLNATVVGTAKPDKVAFVLTDLIECVSDSFVPYLKYGVLWKVFSQDGESKDVLRARYCQARFQEGVALAQAVSRELLEEETANA